MPKKGKKGKGKKGKGKGKKSGFVLNIQRFYRDNYHDFIIIFTARRAEKSLER